jgi:poly(3-hydroxybutyrate) depolymerase
MPRCRISRGVILVAAFAAAMLVPFAATTQPLQDLAAVRARYDALRTAVKPAGDLGRQIADIDTALAQGMRLGRLGDVRRLLAMGVALLSGEPWTGTLDFANSLVLRADRVIADPARPYPVRLEQIYTPALDSPSPLTAHVTLHRPPEVGAADPHARGALVKDLGTFDNVPRDLRDSPYLFDLNLAGVANDRYLVEIEIRSGSTLVALRGLRIDVCRDLDARLAKLEAGLAGVRSDLVEAFGVEVRYPAEFIRKVNRGIVDAGRSDVAGELAAAENVLGSLRRGRDPFARRTGDFKRHYFFADAGEIMPYHLYVPSGYTGRRRLPLVVALHGHGDDEDSYFTSSLRALPTLAEERGYLVVAPLGYRVDGRYGAGSSADAAIARRRTLSEADVMNVIELVRTKYRVDDDRIYLLGHSMGAGGAWYLGAKYPDRWAALACFSGSGTPADEPRMQDIPQFVVHGDADASVPVERSRAMVAEMQRLGVAHRYIEVRGGDHSGVVESNMAAAFDFFDRYRRKR